MSLEGKEILDPSFGVLDSPPNSEKECSLCGFTIFDYGENGKYKGYKGIKLGGGKEICNGCGTSLHSFFLNKLEIEFFYKRLNSIEKQLQDYALGMQRLYDSIQEFKNEYLNGTKTEGSHDEKRLEKANE